MTQLLDAVAANQTLGAVVLALVSAAIGLWLATAWWTYGDLARRVEPELARLAAPAWILASTPVLLPLSLAAYLLVRPQETVAERRAREMLSALAPRPVTTTSCRGCGARIDDSWRRCPTCATWLGAACSHCGRWSPMDFELCPFCASDRSTLDQPAATAPVRVPVPSGERDEPETAASTGSTNREARDARRARRAAAAPSPRLARIGR